MAITVAGSEALTVIRLWLSLLLDPVGVNVIWGTVVADMGMLWLSCYGESDTKVLSVMVALWPSLL